MPISGYGYGVTNDKKCPTCGKSRCKHMRKVTVF